MNAPASTYEMPTIEEEAICEEIAKFWVRHFGGVAEWKNRFAEMVALFDCELDYREGRIDLCGVTDTFEYDHGMTAEDFKRLNVEIMGWIVSYSSAFGRLAI